MDAKTPLRRYMELLAQADCCDRHAVDLERCGCDRLASYARARACRLTGEALDLHDQMLAGTTGGGAA